MTHVKPVTQMPRTAMLDLPENHTLSFLLGNLPASIWDVIALILIHVEPLIKPVE